MAHFHCDRCNHQESLDDDFVGRMARCPDCQQVSRVTTDDGNAAKNLSILQSATTGWRGMAILCGSGLLSFCAVWIWANQPPADHSRGATERVASGPTHPTAELSDQSSTESVSKLKLESLMASPSNLPANALHPEGQSQIRSEPMVAQSTDAKMVAQVDATGVFMNLQPIVVPDRSSVVKHDSPADEVESKHVREFGNELPVVKGDLSTELVEEAARSTKQVAVAKAADPQPAVIVSQASAAAPQKPAHAEHAQHVASTSEGRQLFEHQWTVHDPLAGKGDGLGPVFNARSCVECHFQGGCGGSGTNKHNVETFELLPDQAGAPLLSGVIHGSATETGLSETKEQLKSLLGSPKVPFRTIGSKTSRIIEIDAVRTVALNTPALWGNGLIDKISVRELQKLEVTHPSTGRFHQLADGRIGKFGWKAQIASLHQFVGSACAAELGLSNSIRSQQKPLKYRDDSLAGHDLNDEQLKSLTHFVADLPVPRQVMPESEEGRKEVAAGERIFTTIGCANCHVRDVGVAHGVYSDFRLHNISSGFTKSETYYVFDAIPIYPPEPNAPRLSEWKTPPLWGLADTAPYWHDGSAHTVREAILKHDGEAGVVKTEFEMMTSEQQNRLLAFLDTLKSPAAGLKDH